MRFLGELRLKKFCKEDNHVVDSASRTFVGHDCDPAWGLTNQGDGHCVTTTLTPLAADCLTKQNSSRLPVIIGQLDQRVE